MRPIVVLGLVALVAHTSHPARAGDLRCGVHLVKTGDSTTEVEEKCGLPTSRRTLRGRRGPGKTEIWTYDSGPTEFTRTLVFDRGLLQAIVVGEYGH